MPPGIIQSPVIIKRVGESRHPWAGVYLGPIVFFFLSMKGKILNFLHEVQKIISVISVQINKKKIRFPTFQTKRPHFQEIKVHFLFKVFLY